MFRPTECRTRPPRLLLGTALALAMSAGMLGAVRADDLAQAKADVAAATAPATKWDGPTTGPKAAKDKFIIYVAQSMTNWGSGGSAVCAAEGAKRIGRK